MLFYKAIILELSGRNGASITDLKQWNNLPDNSIGLGATLILPRTRLSLIRTKQRLVHLRKSKQRIAIKKEALIIM
jgi:membrane-bound lytic murein transglycosylase D